MDVNFDKFDKSAVAILRVLASTYPTPQLINFENIFTTEPKDDEFVTHLGAIAALRDAELIISTSASNHILSDKGLRLVGTDGITSHLSMVLIAE